MKKFEIRKDSLKYGNRLIPQFYYYNFVNQDNLKNEGYKSVTIGEIAENISDGEHSAIPRLNDPDGNVRYLYGRNIKEGIVDFDPISDTPYISEQDYEDFPRCHVKPGDVLIEILGTVGKSAIYDPRYIGKAGIPRHIANITLKDDSEVTAEYLITYLRSKEGKKQINSFVTGNIQKLFSLGNIKDYRVLIPNDPTVITKITKLEQTALNNEVTALKLINDTLKQLSAELQKNIKITSSSFTFTTTFDQIKEKHSFTPQRFNPIYKEFERKYHEQFNSVPLDKIALLKHGDEIGSKNYVKYVDSKEEKIPFIRTSDLTNYSEDFYPDYFTDKEEVLQKQDLKNGDILFVKDGKVGETAMVTSTDNGLIASGIEAIRLNAVGKKLGLTPEYVFACLSEKTIGLYSARSRTVIASTLPHLREDKLKEIRIPIVSQNVIDSVTEKIKKAFELKAERKNIMKESMDLLIKSLKFDQ